MCCNIKYVKKYITVKIIKIDLINFERNFIGPSVPIKSKQNHATFGHSWNHNKDLAILCFYRYFNVLTTILQSIVLQNSIEFGLVLPLSAECTHEFLYHSQKRGDTITVHDWFWLLNNVNTELQWEKLKKKLAALYQAALHFCSPPPYLSSI